MQYVFHSTKSRRYRFPTHTNELVIDRADSITSEVFVVILEPGEAPPLHQHDDTEQVFYIIEGRGRLDAGSPIVTSPVATGDLVRIPPSTPHRIHCEGAERLKYIAIDCFVAGRPVAEPTWDSHVRAVCKIQGWDAEKICSQPQR